MKRFKNQAAQGDMLARRIAKLPEGVKPMQAEGGKFILAHSETGHHHIVMERPGIQFFSGMDVLRSYLVVPEGEDAPLVHLRDVHTHETICFEPGVWEITRQREYDVTEGWRLAAD